jgi:hypothetical protein
MTRVVVRLAGLRDATHPAWRVVIDADDARAAFARLADR